MKLGCLSTKVITDGRLEGSMLSKPGSLTALDGNHKLVTVMATRDGWWSHSHTLLILTLTMLTLIMPQLLCVPEQQCSDHGAKGVSGYSHWLVAGSAPRPLH